MNDFKPSAKYVFDREAELRAVGLNGEGALIVCIEAMIEQAFKERPTHPEWYKLGARNAEGISAIRRATEGEGWVMARSKHGLDGIVHLESGRFLAIHNTCERTGLIDKPLPRFAAARRRVATKSLRDDLQGDLFGPLDDMVDPLVNLSPEDGLNLHLCCFIDRTIDEIDTVSLDVRAELIVGGASSDLGFVSAKLRIPLSVSGFDKEVNPNVEFGDGEAFEALKSFRKKP